MSDPAVAVLFLARGIGGGLPAARRFLESYRRHPAGHSHRLYVLAKAWQDVAGYEALRQVAAEVPATVIDLPDDGLDWGAYFRAVDRVPEEWVCCLNTHSEIVCDNWLGLLMRSAAERGVGATGCTGSWGTIAPTRQFIHPIIAELMRDRGMPRAGIAWLHYWVQYASKPWLYSARFGDFPNPHLRSNAFLVRRDILRAFASASRFPRAKYDAFALESGRKSLTWFLAERGLLVRVVGADGTRYASAQWINSRTFRSGRQDNLVISDNQTRVYDDGTRTERRILEIFAWGRCFTP